MAQIDQSPRNPLADLYQPLLARLAIERAACRERVQAIDEAVREAEMWASRRAARHARDRSCYRLGAALEPTGGLAIDDVALAGLDALGKHGVALLAAQALISSDEASLSDLIIAISRSAAGRSLRDWGVWARFTWLKTLYQQEVLDFENSPAAQDERRAWRWKPVKAGQSYLAMELARFLQVMTPELVDRGAAHDWLLEQGGNPRFMMPLERPALPALAELFS